MPKNTEKISEVSIEDRIRDIIKAKLKDSKFKNNLENDDIEVIEKLFEIFPELKDKKTYLLNKKSIQHIINGANIQQPNEILLEEFTYNDIVYFKDINGGIWNEDAELVGTIKGIDKDNKPLCIFFDEKYHDMKLDIDKILSE